MASNLKEQQSPIKRKFSSPLGNQKYVTKGISPRFKANLKDFRSLGTGKQGKSKGDLGPGQARPWRKPQDKSRHRIVRFHCGGNSADPLNLNSLIDRDPSVATPQASPLSEHSESPVQVLEPRDKTDPLNLKGALLEPEIKEAHVAPKKRKKKKRYHINDHNVENEAKPKEQFGAELSEDVATVSEGKRKRKRNTFRTEETNEAELNARGSDKCTAKSAENKDDTTVTTEDSEPSVKKKACIISKTSKDAEKESDNGKMANSSSQNKPERNFEKAKETRKFQGSNKGKHPKRDKHHQAGRPIKKERLFIYGNYNRYYGYRNPQCSQDLRLKCFKREWFEGKDVLDLGCNVGHMTLTIARDFNPQVIMGIDIDTGLIKAAKNNLRYYVKGSISAPGTSERGVDFPVSFSVTSGPLAAPVIVDSDKKLSFPHNVVFKQENYVPGSHEVLSKQKPMYDVILCLSLTKWVHLNWGDEGLKLMFKKIFLNLRPGGRLVLEPQPFSSYKKKKNLTEKIRSNYDAIRFRPEHFLDYLLSVGFAAFEVLEIPQHKASGFQRPMYLLTKSPGVQEASSAESSES